MPMFTKANLQLRSPARAHISIKHYVAACINHTHTGAAAILAARGQPPAAARASYFGRRPPCPARHCPAILKSGFCRCETDINEF